jgi:hypothetical protein
MTTVQVTTETVSQAIKQHVASAKRDSFTTHDIARHMGADEYHVRIAFSWLTRNRVIETIPGVRSVRYTGTAGERYSANVYQLVAVSEKPDFSALMGVFCRA